MQVDPTLGVDSTTGVCYNICIETEYIVSINQKEYGMSQLVMIQKTTREVTPPRDLLNQKELDSCDGVISTAIRLCKKNHPDVKNGEISRFLTQVTGKFIRPQWVFNVLNNPPKKG